LQKKLSNRQRAQQQVETYESLSQKKASMQASMAKLDRRIAAKLAEAEQGIGLHQTRGLGLSSSGVLRPLVMMAVLLQHSLIKRVISMITCTCWPLKLLASKPKC
jgi:hypothetical protein